MTIFRLILFLTLERHIQQYNKTVKTNISITCKHVVKTMLGPLGISQEQENKYTGTDWKSKVTNNLPMTSYSCLSFLCDRVIVRGGVWSSRQCL